MTSFKIHSSKAAGQSYSCSGCADTAPLPVDIDFAFQPIVDMAAQTVFA